MLDEPRVAFLDLVGAHRGHFRLESGHHSTLWLDLDALFSEPRRIAPFVKALCDRVGPYEVATVCGPLLGGAFLAQLVAHALDVEFCFTERVPAQDGAGLYGARYRLPPAFHTRVRGARVAIVDDAMSAGSALLGTFGELQSYGAVPVVGAALLVLGSAGADLFAQHGVAVEAVIRQEYDMWAPAACPLCTAGVPLDEKP